MKTQIFAAARVLGGGNALLVRGDRIVAAGGYAQLRGLAPDAEIVDLAGATITPGFTDSHIHLTEWAVARSRLDLAHTRSVAEVAEAVSRTTMTAGWIIGRGWSAHHWGGSYPTRRDLDAVSPHVPVALQSHDMHAYWLNTRALEKLGDSLDTDPAGGRVLRDADGEPSGVLLENAAQLVIPHLPHFSSGDVRDLVIAAQRELHGYGITGVHSFPGVHLVEPAPMPVLQEMLANGELKLRVLQHIALDQLDDYIALGLRSGFGGKWIRLGGVKMFLDGALGSRTALMREPYENSSDLGVSVMPEAEFRATVQRAARAGIASVVHAIGDAAVTLAFDVLSDPALRVRALPHRIEHVQCLPTDMAEVLASGVICSVQPSHLMSDWRAADTHWGRRAANTYAFRFMRDRGAVLAFGSDAPVEPADPRHGLFAAVARRDLALEPGSGWHLEQALSIEEALEGYTSGPAHAAGLTAPGLVAGALADFVAWRQDPLHCAPEELLSLTPVATVVGGEVVHAG